jgi:hypothetical protein
MPTTEIVNTQQTLQMGTHAEKLQQTMQQLPSTTAQQIQEEQVAVNELKQIEVQDPEKIEAADSTSAESKRRREIRLRNKSKQNNDLENPIPSSLQDNAFKGDSHQGQNINLTI